MTDYTVDVFSADDDQVPFATFDVVNSDLNPAVGEVVPLGDPVGRYGPFQATILSIKDGASSRERLVEVSVEKTDRELNDYATVSNWRRHRQVPARRDSPDPAETD